MNAERRPNAAGDDGPDGDGPDRGPHGAGSNDGGDLVARLVALAERFDALADTAELMGDPAALERFRADAASCRLRAMARLDESPPDGS